MTWSGSSQTPARTPQPRKAMSWARGRGGSGARSRRRRPGRDRASVGSSRVCSSGATVRLAVGGARRGYSRMRSCSGSGHRRLQLARSRSRNSGPGSSSDTGLVHRPGSTSTSVRRGGPAAGRVGVGDGARPSDAGVSPPVSTDLMRLVARRSRAGLRGDVVGDAVPTVRGPAPSRVAGLRRGRVHQQPAVERWASVTA